MSAHHRCVNLNFPPLTTLNETSLINRRKCFPPKMVAIRTKQSPRSFACYLGPKNFINVPGKWIPAKRLPANANSGTEEKGTKVPARYQESRRGVGRARGLFHHPRKCRWSLREGSPFLSSQPFFSHVFLPSFPYIFNIYSEYLFLLIFLTFMANIFFSLYF